MALAANFSALVMAGKASPGVMIYIWIYGREIEYRLQPKEQDMAKNLIFAAMFTATLSAGALSLHQLRTVTHAVVACGSPCTRGDVCKSPCFCFFGINGTTGTCQPEGPSAAPRK